MEFNTNDHPHRRLNILTGEWVLVSPHRTKRPWQGKTEKPQNQLRPSYDAQCYLCPGNERAGGIQNPNYQSAYSFKNDFAALLEAVPKHTMNENNLLIAKSERGMCKVICFSPNHQLTLAQMEVEDIHKVVDLWTEEYKILGEKEFINYVQIFENKGAIMGCSNPHPHGQIWAQESIPDGVAKELVQFEKHFKKTGRSLLADYLDQEQSLDQRIIVENNSFVALVPFWALWPYETIIISKRHVQSLLDFTKEEREDYAEIIKRLTIKYDNLFQTSFPYSSGIHQKPTDGKPWESWHFHMHFYPPLLRSASVKKFMVGYEMLGEPQRDFTPEYSAERLKKLPNVHYTKL